MRSFVRFILVTIAVLISIGSEVTRAFDRMLPILAHYSSEFAPVGFVLDLTAETPKLKFDGNEEILVLRWIPAAGGDRLLEREDHFVLLRISGLGGVTLFTPQNTRGVPVAPDNARVAPLQAPQMNAPSIAEVREFASRIMAQARSETGRDVIFDANWDEAARNAVVRALLFDCVRNAGTALIDWIHTTPGRDAAGVILRRIRFVLGPPALPYRQGDMLVIVFSPGQGLAGRPASATIFRQMAQFAR